MFIPNLLIHDKKNKPFSIYYKIWLEYTTLIHYTTAVLLIFKVNTKYSPVASIELKDNPM